MLINSTTVKSLDLVDGSKLTFDIASAKMIDVCITTPLFVSEYKNGINLGLVRMLNNNTNVGFGKGTNLNVCYKLAKTNDTTLVLTHPTFEQEQFVLDDDASTFKSTISDRYITKTAACYTLYDSNTEIEFIEMHDDLKQYYITVKGQNSYKLLFVYNEDKLWGIGNDNELAESVGFIYDSITGNCTSIVSGKKMDASSDDVTQIGKAELTYTNNIVSQVSIKMHNKTAIKRKSIFTATTTQIVVSDGISSITNIIKLGKLSPSNEYYVKELHIDNQKLLVTYNDYKTTLLLKVNKTTNDEVEVNKEEYFFNKNYELSFVKVNDRIVKAFNYELNERHRLRGYSKELYVKPELNGEYYTFDSYKHWSNHTVQTTTDPNCPASTVVNRITFDYYDEDFDDPSLQFTFNQSGTKLDVINVLIWYRTNQTITNLYYKVEANLNIVKSSGTFTKTTMFDTIYLNLFNNEWQFAILTLQAGEDFEKVFLNFKPNTYGIILDVHMALYKNSFTTIYRYDRDGKIEATLTGKDYSFYKFNQDNQLMLSKNTVNSYDGNGRVIQSVSPKKVVSSTTYDDKGNMTSQKVHKVNETGFMGKQFTYEAGELLSQVTNEDLTTQTFGYDSYKRQNASQFGNLDQNITFVTDDNVKYGLVQSAELKEGNNIQGKLSYEYDYYLNLSKASSTNDDVDKTTIKYAYDSNKRVTKVSNYYKTYTPSTGNGIQNPDIGPGMSIIPGVEENEIENKLYECTYDDMGNIKSYNYGDSSKNVSYEYEETDRTTLNNVKKIKYCNEDKYEFEYSNDGKGLLSKVTSHDTIAANGEELSTNYEYDNNQIKTIKIKGGSATYHTNELKYNQNNEAFIERNITGESVLETEYLDSSKIAFDSINGFEYSLLSEQDDDLYWTMFIDRKAMVNDKIIDWSHVLSNKNGQILPYPLAYDISDVDYESNNQYRDCGLRMFIVPNQTTPYYLNFRKPSDEEGIENYDYSTRKLELGNQF